MSVHLEQAKHNYQLYQSLKTSFPSDFGDWKLTVLYYTALHLVHALAEHWKTPLTGGHYDIRRSLNPDNPNRTLRVSPHFSKCFEALYKQCDIARYRSPEDPNGFAGFLSKRSNKVAYCEAALEQIINDCKGYGLSMP